MIIRLSLLLLGLLVSADPLAGASSRRVVQRQDSCTVRLVVDGDTFHCGDGRKVRLIGIDSPERQQRPFGSRAHQALVRMLPTGLAVRLEHDVALTDRYGRLLAYVWIGPTLVNETMVQDGWAVLYTMPPNIKYAERFRQAQNEARARGMGLWAQNGFACLPKDFRKRVCLSSP